jgi:catechol 2,3-dioxygenase-like lactoylglutathione lyase family enzyme
MDMSVGVLDHYNVSTRKLKETITFYEDVLGMKNGPRPPFDFPGAWIYSAGHPVLHINDISDTDKIRQWQPVPIAHAGREQPAAEGKHGAVPGTAVTVRRTGHHPGSGSRRRRR